MPTGKKKNLSFELLLLSCSRYPDHIMTPNKPIGRILILNWVISVFHTNLKPSPPTLPQTHSNPNWSGKVWKWAITSKRRKNGKLLLVFFFFVFLLFIILLIFVICFSFISDFFCLLLPSSVKAQAQAWGWNGYISIVTTTNPPTHPDKFKFDIEQHKAKSKVAYLVWPINVFGSFLGPIIATLYQHQA